MLRRLMGCAGSRRVEIGAGGEAASPLERLPSFLLADIVKYLSDGSSDLSTLLCGSKRLRETSRGSRGVWLVLWPRRALWSHLLHPRRASVVMRGMTLASLRRLCVPAGAWPRPRLSSFPSALLSTDFRSEYLGMVNLVRVDAERLAYVRGSDMSVSVLDMGYACNGFMRVAHRGEPEVPLADLTSLEVARRGEGMDPRGGPVNDMFVCGTNSSMVVSVNCNPGMAAQVAMWSGETSEGHLYLDTGRLAICGAYLPAHNSLVIGGQHNFLRVFKLLEDGSISDQKIKLQGMFDHMDWICGVAPVHGGALLAVAATRCPVITVVRMSTGRTHTRLVGHAGHVYAMCELPGSEVPMLVSGGDDGTARVWELEGGNCAAVLRHPSSVIAVHSCVPGTLVASDNSYGVRVWHCSAPDGRWDTGEWHCAHELMGLRQEKFSSVLQLWNGYVVGGSDKGRLVMWTGWS